MGRGGKSRRGARGGGANRGRAGRRSQPDNRQSYADIPKSNEQFERFYNTLSLVPAGEEREAFWAAYRRELPNAFRFTGSKGHAQIVRRNLTERFFPTIAKIEHNDEPVDLPKQIPWYPDGLAYSMTTPKNVVRKYEPFKDFQKFLVSETGVGNISRQEQVSMIPPLLLEVQPHHTVLDLCAAPGSKSAQLIEAIHAGEEERVAKAIERNKEVNGADAEAPDQGRSTGLLVANDVNYQRAQMLVHQVKRLNSPNIVVTNHDATMMPSIALPPSVDPRFPDRPARRRYLKYDRILADVPCSGDGTARKNVNVWKDWSPVNAIGLYLTQVRILVRALQMLKAGGRVAYSTCSLNPLENEAVVASAIERCGGSAKVKIVDCSGNLPGLKRMPGLTDWSIMARGGQMYESWEEAQQFESPEAKVRVSPGMFPPDPAEEIPLERCMRVYPHLQDTGGFFICVLEKLSEMKAKPENESKCVNRNWSLDTVAAPATAIVDELRQTATNGTGHPSAHIVSAETLVPAPLPETSDPSAAQRSNASVQSAAAKRRTEDTELPDSKRPKTDDRNEDTPFAADADIDIPVPLASAIPRPTEHLPLPPSVESGLASTQHPSSNADKRSSRADQGYGEAFKYLPTDHVELQGIADFYDIHPEFPRDRFLVRNHAGDPVKGIYYTSALVKDILVANATEGLKFVHAGVKMFMKQDVQKQENVCRWRIQTEGLPIIDGWVGEARVVRLYRRSTLRKLLVEMFPRLGGPAGEEGWREIGEIGERVRDMPMGCCVLRIETGKDRADEHGNGTIDGDEGFAESLSIPLWRSLYSLNLMLPKEERKALLLRIFNEDVELINNVVQKDQQPVAESQTVVADADATTDTTPTTA